MTDANYPTTSSPIQMPTSSLADLVHKSPLQPPLTSAPLPTPRPRPPDSDDGSQQERNHQHPSRPLHNLPRLPPPSHVTPTATARNTNAADTSPKHPYRKRKHSQSAPPVTPPDLSSLTQKLDDHASSIARLPPSAEQPNFPPLQEHDHPSLDKVRPPRDLADGSTEINPIPSSALANIHENHSLDKDRDRHRRRPSLKDPPQRTELLEENRALRIELESLKFRLRQTEKSAHKHRKEMHHKDLLLAKYRSQLVDLFEAGDGDLFHVNKEKYSPQSPQNPPHRQKRDDMNSKVDGESISNSQEEDWSTYSPPSMSIGYDHEKFEDRRRGNKDPYARSEATIRKHKRTRAPPWTPGEEVIFMQAYNKHGCQWKLFQDSLPGRSRRQIQSHGSYLIRQGKLLKKNSRPWQRRKPRAADPGNSTRDADIDADEIDRSDRE